MLPLGFFDGPAVKQIMYVLEGTSCTKNALKDANQASCCDTTPIKFLAPTWGYRRSRGILAGHGGSPVPPFQGGSTGSNPVGATSNRAGQRATFGMSPFGNSRMFGRLS